MKKTVVSALAITFALLNSEAWCSWVNQTAATIGEAKDSAVAKVKTLTTRDHENYWLNNVRTFRSYPINFYDSYASQYEDNTQAKEVAVREYKHNVAVSANLGQRMLDSETFTVTTHFGTANYQVESDTIFYSVAGELKLKAGEKLSPIGETKIDGLYYLLFDPREDGRIVMIDESGRFLHIVSRIYRKELVLSREITNVYPKYARVNEASGLNEVKGQPKFNFELRYDGLDGDKMSFLYISDETDGKAQRFTYPTNQKVIDIYGNKLQIIKPYKDKVEYMILD